MEFLPWLLQKLCMVIQYCPTIKMRSRRMKLAPLVDIFVKCELIACMVGLEESGRKAYYVAEKTLTPGNLVTSYIYIYIHILVSIGCGDGLVPHDTQASIRISAESKLPCGIHMRAISQETHLKFIHIMYSDITVLQWFWYLPVTPFTNMD